MSNFSFTHSAYKRLVLQTHKNQGLFGKGFLVKKKKLMTSNQQPFLVSILDLKTNTASRWLNHLINPFPYINGICIKSLFLLWLKEFERRPPKEQKFLVSILDLKTNTASRWLNHLINPFPYTDGICIKSVTKSCGQRKKCWQPVISFLTMFLKALCLWVVNLN